MSRREKPIGKKTDCTYCEGSKFHFGKKCGTCDGTGSNKVQKQLDNVYRAKNGLPLRIKKTLKQL